jgi:PAS domain S-box-containing protein
LSKIFGGARFAVFRARSDDGLQVVIKQAMPGPPDRRSGERLRHEYNLLRRLDAPGVSRPLELITVDGCPALVFEDAGPRNLAELIGGRPLAVPLFFDLAIAIAEGLRVIHSRNVIHRDICPENIVIADPPTKITIVDFESATAVPAFAERPGMPGALEGTLAYMAPEQTGRMRRLVDRRADLYALGAVYYEMLTGQPPFRARDPLELVHAHAARPPHAPAVVNSAVPTLVSDIVVKLLAKMPEWRYQSAAALAADLEEARRQWREHGQITGFELGRRDLPYELFLESETLYGRDHEIRRLTEAVARTAAGESEAVLVTGVAGIGKSALVHGVQHLSSAKSWWIAGKGDLLRGNVPYAALIEAFRGLVQTLLAEPAEALGALRERIQQATAPNGRVLTDAIPDLQALLGDQPPVARLGPVEDENRFQLTFTAFVRALLASHAPLVLFLDDLQWIDAASLKLLHAVAVDPEIRSLLILCAYRSEEVSPDHPIARSLERARSAGARLTRIELGPLDSNALVGLLCDALRAEPLTVAPLARLFRRKTASNPFFIRQFLGYLYREHLLVFHADRGQWDWSLARIEAAAVTPNVVDLLSQVIATLPRDAQEALQVAACIGNRFELSLLAGVQNVSMDVAAEALWAPVEQGLIVPAVEGPRFDWALTKPVELGTAVAPAFRFVHDRIQQAAYERLSDAARQALHLRIGRWLQENVPEAALESAVAPIVDQLNRAAELLSDRERTRLASLNARAGEQARATAAYSSALGYLQTGLRLLPEAAWNGELHPLWFELQRDAAECAGLTGDLELSERLVDEGIARTDVPVEKGDFYAISVHINALGGAHPRAIERGRQGLAALGAELPEPSPSVVSAEMERARAALRERSERQLLEAPPMTDALERARFEILVHLTSGWFVAPELFQIVSSRATALTATRGLAPGSALAYTCFGIALAMRREYDDAYRFGHIGAQLAERLANPAEESRALLCMGGHISPWRAPLADSVAMLERSNARGVESGELEFAAYALANLVFARMFGGAQLDQVLVQAESALAFYRKIRHLSGVPYVAPFVQAVKCLKGLTRRTAGFDDDRFDEAQFLVEAAANGLGQAMFHVLGIQAGYLLGRPDLAQQYAARAVPWLPYLRTLFFQADFHFYFALTLCSLAAQAPSLEGAAMVSEAHKHRRQLEAWSASSPTSFQHKHDLVSAELARIERSPDAIALYHRAIEGAGHAGFQQDEALAHELCGRFHRSRGADRVADCHLNAALDGYLLWGATAKAELLCREFPSLRRQRIPTPTLPPALDYYSLARTSEMLTEELAFEPLLTKLVRSCAQAAEATRTVLILDEDGLVGRATATATGEVTLERRPLASSPSVAVSVVEHVFRSKEALVLGDAAREGRFTRDPYIVAHGVRSLLVVPIVRADRAYGVLYFENNLTSDGFTPERLEMFRLLSAQVAIALENSRLFEQRKRSEAALRLLSQTSDQLTETLEYRDVVSRISAVAVPALADFCVVDAMEDGVLRPIAWAHVDPSLSPAVEELHRRYPPDANSPQPQGQVWRSKKALLISEVTDEVISTASRDENHRRLVRALAPRSLMVVPLVARGRSIGTVTFASSSPTRRYDGTDLALAEEMVRRIGVAIDNARLHRDLQEALRQREERDRHLRMIFRRLPGTVWAVDRNLQILYATGRLLNIPGLDERKLVGTSGYDFLGTSDPTDAVIAHHMAALQGERQSFEYPFHGRWYAVLVDPLRDRRRQIVGCVGAAFDITEKREVAERLAQSERRLCEAQHVAHVGSFEWDIEPNVMTWSDELQRIYGVEPGQFGRTFEAFLERVPADEAEETRRVFLDAFSRSSPFAHDHRIVRTDGSIRVLHSRGDVARDARGRPTRLVGTCWDITEQKELIRKLEQAVSRWEATINATADGILVTDLDGTISAVNQRFLSLWQVPDVETEGRQYLALLAPVIDQLEDADAFLARLRDVYGHKMQETFDVIRFKDGRIYERSSIPQRIGDAIAGRVWSVRDVTERERLLRRAVFLADATRLLASLDVEQALDGVAHLAVPYLGDGCAIDLFGDGGPRRLIAISRDPRMPIAADVHPAVLGGNAITYELGGICYLGVPLLMKGHLVGAITFAASRHRKYTPRDRELAEELARRASLAIDNARLYRRAREALSARDEFLSIAAHEIRGPIHSIHLAIQSIREGKLPAQALPKLFEVVERQDRRLSHFVDELLDLGRIRAARFHLEYEDVNLVEVVHDVAARLGPDLARSGSSLAITARGQIVGQWDKSRVDQVAFNLLSNAIKFGLGKPIEILVDAHDGRGIVVVRDNGMGIDPELRSRLFKPFERGLSARHYGGLGLGLHIVKSIVDALGGSVTIESEPGSGSMFVVELPQARAGAEEDAHPNH